MEAPTEPQPAAGPDNQEPRQGGFPYATWGPWVAVGATVSALIAGLLISLPFIAMDNEPGDDLALGTTVAVQLCTALGFMIVPFMLAQSAGGSPRDAWRRLGFVEFEIGRTAKWIGLGVLAYFAFSILYGTIFGTPEQDDIAGEFGPIPLQILMIAIVAPVVEEVCFRGMLFGGIRTRLPLWAAAIAAGVVFGLLHWTTGWGAVVPLMALGAILCVVYEKSGSIWGPIIFHVLNNGIALIALNA